MKKIFLKLIFGTMFLISSLSCMNFKTFDEEEIDKIKILENQNKIDKKTKYNLLHNIIEESKNFLDKAIQNATTDDKRQFLQNMKDNDEDRILTYYANNNNTQKNILKTGLETYKGTFSKIDNVYYEIYQYEKKSFNHSNYKETGVIIIASAIAIGIGIYLYRKFRKKPVQPKEEKSTKENKVNAISNEFEPATN